MRTRLGAAAVMAGLSALWPAFCMGQEAPNQLGVGVYIGAPFGFSAKYLIDRNFAADVAAGVQGSSLDGHGDVLVHFRDLFPQPASGKFAPYLGLGLKLKGESEVLTGVRFVGGAVYLIKGTPLEVFAEIVPVLRITPSQGSNLDGGVGLRYYFDLPARK